MRTLLFLLASISLLPVAGCSLVSDFGDYNFDEDAALGTALAGVGEPCTSDDGCLPGLHCEDRVCCAAGSTCCTDDDHCGPGVTCNTAVAECHSIACEADQQVVGHACVACPPGTTNQAGDDAAGDDTSCDSVLCAADQRVQDRACVSCPAGTANAEGDDASAGDTACDPILCAADQRVLGHDCVACPPGTTNRAGDDASVEDTECDGELCASNQRVLGHDCVACPPGTTNQAGDDAAGYDTNCESVLCAADQQVVSHDCVACPLGTTNQAGDNASGADTGCDPILCKADNHVQHHSCVSCPAGTANAEGDDASAGDTACDPILCDSDHRVLDHACVACPPGTTNQAGGDASGPDTRCEDPDFNIAFLSPDPWTGDMGGLKGADGICNKYVEETGISGTYRAILSTDSVNAGDRLGDARGWVRPDKHPVGDLPSEIFQYGGLLAPIRIDLAGNDLGQQRTWSASSNTGRRHNSGTDCGGWTSEGRETSRSGFSDTTAEWLDRGSSTACQNQLHIYCFQVDYYRQLDKSDWAVAGRRLFVSTGKFDTSSGWNGAYGLCAADVKTRGLDGSFKPLLADAGRSAASRFESSNLPVVRLDGLLVAANLDALSTTDIVHPPVLQGDGAIWNGRVFTGAARPDVSGTGTTTCSGWSKVWGKATVGLAYGTSHTGAERLWFGNSPEKCTRSGQLPVYCLED